MKVDLNLLKKEKKNQVDLNLQLNLDTINYYGDKFLLPNPISLEGKIYNVSNEFFLACQVKTLMEVSCSRCLKPFTYDYSSKINVQLVEEKEVLNEDDDLEDIFFYHDGIISLEDIVKENIIMNIPIQLLCSEACKGICAGCGEDLNDKECKCITEENHDDGIDPRLAKLKKLLQQD
ncbi:YceD family protein [Alkaliphilus serpentinus]|uniref:DUF177 domain-containing protein n=1 Tax=Alkaliphilus serpentinus TaxID=1482731 RepID=A0A833HPZ8_9FIRM|nr:DUF177 domain-containing protein [Alkaliphilus serpentinus]KAB3531425.1 DUF177 domain-containing protein [Alkaliphilus serpentinus]